MPELADFRATLPEELAELSETVKGTAIHLDALAVREPARTVVLSFERVHPLRETWEIVVWGARSVEVADRREQKTDFLRPEFAVPRHIPGPPPS
jgi:hypothetical protein